MHSGILQNNHSSAFWRNRPVLVTGGAGFIGSWLADGLIRRGADVTILDIKKALPDAGGHYDTLRSKGRYIQGDVRDEKVLEDILRRYHITTVFHLAAEAIVGNALKDPGEALDTNIRGTWTVLEAVRRLNPKIHVITASSDKAYGAHETLPYTEEFSLSGRNPYDCSKSCADLIAQMYGHTYGLCLVVTRCGNVYGGGDLNFSRLVPDTIRSLWHGKAPVIRSDGMFRRDYVFVSDIVSAYLSTAEALIAGEMKHHVFNFGTGAPQRAIDMVSRITELMDTTLQPVILSEAQYEIKDQYLDASRAQETLRWHPRVGLEEGLVDTIAWYKEYFRQSGITSSE
ncbi:hypothetical protein A2935_01645 [Candidatus Wolfebacteria bacterium RIFCSPLOWO2_01_FULL_47_17b]|uniref:NAD(P)-binding domain-containing protein n=1 Tax=Candidatus Wolfebacteria bacterium RIFCSPLOWO2_01_FULL_47_17b TaxID=1802558 RepID=A0A1F8DYW0_9BACT|nr:MAG: hypothetical protein A2935_01645 [Candidatus Wolfebacteria bacterium RIFCSPLOWO2_01_FULL_47_17b]